MTWEGLLFFGYIHHTSWDFRNYSQPSMYRHNVWQVAKKACLLFNWKFWQEYVNQLDKGGKPWERYLTAEETRRLLEAVEKSKNTQLKYIVPLLLLLGCRKREFLDAKWEEFDLDRRIWRIPMNKSGKSRHVLLSKTAMEIIQKLPRFEGCPFLLPNLDTLKPFVQLHRAWDYARKAAGLPEVRLHDCRHSCASFLINSNRSIHEVAKILGHS